MPTAHPAASRILWRGAISFGLVHIPVALHSATRETSIDFDWLDRRTLDRVGYQRINKATGEVLDHDTVAKGVPVEGGRHVLLGDEEIAAAYPKTTQTIAIEAFVDAHEIPLPYLAKPYYLAPVGKAAKAYALLRETLRNTGKAGIARVVISRREHLAALLPQGAGLVLNLLRWGDGVRTLDALELPPESGTAAGIQPAELEMAGQLVAQLSRRWEPDDWQDRFSEKVMALVRKKAEAGRHEPVRALEAEPEDASDDADPVDLAALLERSLGIDGDAADEKGPTPTEQKETAAREADIAPAPARKHRLA